MLSFVRNGFSLGASWYNEWNEWRSKTITKFEWEPQKAAPTASFDFGWRNNNDDDDNQ